MRLVRSSVEEDDFLAHRLGQARSEGVGGSERVGRPLPLVGSPSQVHFMILWGMIAIAGAAGVMAVSRSFGLTAGLMMSGSLSLVASPGAPA